MFFHISSLANSIFTQINKIGSAYPILYASSSRYLVQLTYYSRPPVWSRNRELKCWNRQSGLLLSKFVFTTVLIDADCSSTSSKVCQCFLIEMIAFKLESGIGQVDSKIDQFKRNFSVVEFHPNLKYMPTFESWWSTQISKTHT